MKNEKAIQINYFCNRHNASSNIVLTARIQYESNEKWQLLKRHLIIIIKSPQESVCHSVSDFSNNRTTVSTDRSVFFEEMKEPTLWSDLKGEVDPPKSTHSLAGFNSALLSLLICFNWASLWHSQGTIRKQRGSDASLAYTSINHK